MVAQTCCLLAAIPAIIIGIIILLIRGIIAFFKFSFTFAGIFIIIAIVWYLTEGRRNDKK